MLGGNNLLFIIEMLIVLEGNNLLVIIGELNILERNNYLIIIEKLIATENNYHTGFDSYIGRQLTCISYHWAVVRKEDNLLVLIEKLIVIW